MNVVSSPKVFPTVVSPWNEVVLLYRRICVLRAQELHAEAEEMRAGEFARVLAAAEASLATDPAQRSQLEALFAREEERVANAAVLAALLGPMLREQLRPEPTHFAFAPTPLPNASAPANEESVAAPSASASRPPLSIADFIDGMLQQEKPLAPRAPQRRAS